MSSSKCYEIGDIRQLLRTVTLLVCIGEVPDSSLFQETGYPD
jgi:hypothetical protein